MEGQEGHIYITLGIFTTFNMFSNGTAIGHLHALLLRGVDQITHDCLHCVGARLHL